MSFFLCGVVITLTACVLLGPRLLAHLGRLLAEPEGAVGKCHIVPSALVGVGLALLIVILFTLLSLWLVPPPIDTIESAK
jgi:hypothetical protein